MKKLLLTTTALAGMTGAAVADVSLSGTGTINLRTDTAANTWSSDASLVASMSSSGAYAAAVTVNLAEWGTDGNAKGSGTGATKWPAPTAAVTLTAPMATLTVSDKAGIDEASMTYSKVSGMTGIGTESAASVSVTANLGDISASYSSDLTMTSASSSFGASGTMGGISFTVGSENEEMGISLSGSAFGGTVKVAMEELAAASNTGISIAIPVSGSTLTLNADDTSGVDGWSASVATTVNGASVTVGTNDAGTTTVDVSAPIAGGATFVADYSTAANSSEYGVSYDLGGGATFLVSHSEYSATTDSGADYGLGTNIKLSFAF